MALAAANAVVCFKKVRRNAFMLIPLMVKS
jgi:hypothetical protein